MTIFETIASGGGIAAVSAVAFWPLARRAGNAMGLIFGGRLERIENAARAAAAKAEVAAGQVKSIAQEIGANNPTTPSIGDTVNGIAVDLKSAMQRQKDDFDATSKTLLQHTKLFEDHGKRITRLEKRKRVA